MKGLPFESEPEKFVYASAEITRRLTGSPAESHGARQSLAVELQNHDAN
jgi:hypothetical protein